MPTDIFRILLVEDNDADVYLFRKALIAAELSFELTVIEDGARALAFVRGEGEFAGSPVPHLAIIDVSLPKNDGIQIVEALRGATRFDDMLVVVASSSAAPHPRLKDGDLRVARYISKPPDFEPFLKIGDTLKEILLQSRPQRAGR